jgi:hypothetical protein
MTPRPDREAFRNNKHAAGGKGAVRPRVLTPPPRQSVARN